MRRLLLVVLGTLLLAGAMPANPEETVEGVLMDTQCYLKVGLQESLKDKKCLTECARAGIPTAIVTSAGKVYVLVTPSARLADHMTKRARITGGLKGGMLVPRTVEVQEGDIWTSVSLK